MYAPLMARIGCADCGRHYSGTQASGGHCAACHQNFQSQTAFDKHRRGPYTARRCLTTAQLTGDGWQQQRRGWAPPQKRWWPQA